MKASAPTGTEILSRGLRADALKIVRHIVHRLVAVAEEEADHADASLGFGLGGVALALAYTAAYFGDRRLQVQARGIFRIAATRLLDEQAVPPLLSGLAGLGWSIHHFRRFGIHGYGALEQDIRRALRLYVRGASRPTPGILNGLAGIGIYLLERPLDLATQRDLATVVERLGELAITTGEGSSWADDEAGERQPHFNVGAALGAPGILLFLARYCQSTAAARRRGGLLLARCAGWLWARRMSDAAPPFFPYQCWGGTAPGQVTGTQLAWCYGDLPALAGLGLAAAVTGDIRMRKGVGRMVSVIARMEPSAFRVVDASVCHGACGAAILLLWLRAAGASVPRPCLERWYRTAIDCLLRREFRFLKGEGTALWQDDHSLMTGTSGVALSLLAALDPRSREWLRVLGLGV
jgi:hypothetical protein